MSQRPLEPSDFLRTMQHHWNEELKHLRGQAPLWRCFDCKRAIPREELPLRCEECSGASEHVKRHKFSKIKRKLVTQDAMICIKCVDKHDHLRKMVEDLQFQVYARGLERRAMEAANVTTKSGIALLGEYNAN